jgi:hypothetical protein
MLITKDIFGNTSTKITPNSVKEVSSILIIAKRRNGVPTYKKFNILSLFASKKWGLMGDVQMMNIILGPRVAMDLQLDEVVI